MTKRCGVSAPPTTNSANVPGPVAGGKSKTRTSTDALAFASHLSLEIRYIAPSELIEYPNNPRAHSPDQIEKIAESIKSFGFVSPLIVDPERQLVAGHGRLAAAKLLGLDRVPVVSLHHLDDAQKKALRIADNRLAELAGWDQDILAIEFSSLIELDADSRSQF